MPAASLLACSTFDFSALQILLLREFYFAFSQRCVTNLNFCRKIVTRTAARLFSGSVRDEIYNSFISPHRRVVLSSVRKCIINLRITSLDMSQRWFMFVKSVQKKTKKLAKLMQKYLLVLKIVFESGLRRIMKFMRSAIVLHSRLEVLFRYNAELQGYVSRIGYRLTCKRFKF